MTTLRRTDSGQILLVILAAAIFFTAASRSAPAGQNAIPSEHSFRWATSTGDPQLWQEIQSAFQPELAPDKPKSGQDALDVFAYKAVAKIGVFDRSALVFLHSQPTTTLTRDNSWDQYDSIYNFDLATKTKSPVKGAERLWDWKFNSLLKLGPSDAPSVTFTYQTCTECEPTVILNALFYDAGDLLWKFRSWGDGKSPWWASDDGLAVDLDLIASDDQIAFDCVYGSVDSKSANFQALGVRCKNVHDQDKGRAKIDDQMLVFGFAQGQLKSERVTDPSQIATLTATLCRTQPKRMLCKLPGYMTVTPDANAVLDALFPIARRTSRELKDFHVIQPGVTMQQIAERCGSPDEVGGSGISIFLYYLQDESIVAIGATGTTTPIFYATHITYASSRDLLPKQAAH